jgi:hypothetical protein
VEDVSGKILEMGEKKNKTRSRLKGHERMYQEGERRKKSMLPNEAEHFQFNGICTIFFCFFLFLLFSLLLHLTRPAHLGPDYLTPNPSTNPANMDLRR